MSADYVELRVHSWYSFGGGVPAPAALAQHAAGLGYPALGLTDAANLCGALEFAQACEGAGVRPLFGVDLPVREGDRVGTVTLLAADGDGYANICRLASLAHLTGGHRTPELDSRFLDEHAAGVIALPGAPDSVLAGLIADGRWSAATGLVKAYVGRFGQGSVFLQLQQHLAHGDTFRNRRMNELARQCGVGVVATNEPWFLRREDSRLHDCLTAIRHNVSLNEVRNRLKPNSHWWLKPPAKIGPLLRRYPDALSNTVAIAERCGDFRLPAYLRGRYAFPDVRVPPGYDAQGWLEELCRQAAARRYGRVDRRVTERLEQEFALIRQHGLAGFFLVYYRIVELAREVMLDLGWGHRETPLEWLSPGRGRGSSVSMLVGYLIGLSHVDPLEYGLSLDRFLSAETDSYPDIDLDFPRDVRERLIVRVIEEWGWDHAALAGMFATYRTRGVLRGLGKALGLPADEVGILAGGWSRRA